MGQIKKPEADNPVSRPNDYPLVDQNTLRSFSCRKGITVGLGVDFKRSWATYKKYRQYFST